MLFHGRGADEHDLFPLLDALDPERRLLGVTVRGPLSLPPGGAHWYPAGRARLPRSGPRSCPHQFELVAGWLDGFAAATGIEPARTVLGGFSQGAVMTYALGLGQGRPRPAALVALSGFIPTVPGYELNLEPPLPPVAIGHGVQDPVIGVEWARRAAEVLRGAGAEPLVRESPAGPHDRPGVPVRRPALALGKGLTRESGSAAPNQTRF